MKNERIYLGHVQDAIDDLRPLIALFVAFMSGAELLLTFPEMGYRYREHPDVRVLLYGHYRIAYLITSERNVEILGVFHGALDVRRYLTPIE